MEIESFIDRNTYLVQLRNGKLWKIIVIRAFLMLQFSLAFGGDVKTTLTDSDRLPAAGVDLTSLFPGTTFHKSLYALWSPDHAEVSQDESNVKLKLDAISGCAIKSIETYYHGFFSVSVKLPGNYSAGVVTTFYMSNNEEFPENHDEFDFEFLGTVPGEPYTIQTNIYSDGRTDIGREQRFRLWFDPTEDFHNYSFLWTANHTVFFVDSIPIWEFPNMVEMGSEYPSKHMSLYATIWDASRWATDGGRYRVNYAYQPFVATYSNFILSGCSNFNPSVSPEACPAIFDDNIPPGLSRQQLYALHWVQINHRFYTYCNDTKRYPDLTEVPECLAERESSRSRDHNPKRVVYASAPTSFSEPPSSTQPLRGD